jgi:hypothetical protein
VAPSTDLLARIRAWTVFFIAGLVVSGATAIPIQSEVRVAQTLLGDDLSAQGRIPPGGSAWLRTVRDAINTTAERAPLMFYGTDWLAFGHFVIAIAYIGALRDPVRNRWLYQFGMIACALVPLVDLRLRRSARHPAVVAGDRRLIRSGGVRPDVALPSLDR